MLKAKFLQQEPNTAPRFSKPGADQKRRGSATLVKTASKKRYISCGRYSLVVARLLACVCYLTVREYEPMSASRPAGAPPRI